MSPFLMLTFAYEKTIMNLYSYIIGYIISEKKG